MQQCYTSSTRKIIPAARRCGLRTARRTSPTSSSIATSSLWAGALLAEDGTTRTGSVLIINVPDLAAAEAFSREEPFRKAGLFRTVKITRMRRGQWNPAAVPKSAEGR